MNDRRNSCSALRMCCFVLALLSCQSMWADEEAATKSGFDVSSMEQQEGFFDFCWDNAEGRIWLAIEEFDQPFLYVSSLATGLGSNPVGLDRGQLGESRVVHFRRVGKSVFLVQENLKYRATTTNALEKRAIRDSFAESVLWSGELKTATDGSTFVDLTDFLLRDAHDCIGTLAATDQGSFSLAKSLSYVHMPRTKSFPKNSEFEVALTLTSNKPGRLARRVAADGKSITLRQHHSFVELPDENYRPRKNDPRAGCFAVGYADYGVPIDESVEKEWITRHRLEKQNPAAKVSPAKEPIVYYIDPGVPQPVRDALIEGASWWNEAFESAGFENAFQVRVLPEDVDPMDVRYNVVQWVHRATRGWSYGQSVVDPRTGEIIKGHVLLGSLRVRQDHLLFEGLTSRSAAQGASACPCGMSDMSHGMFLPQLDSQLSSAEVALARIRQLSAHEVGHTLGFAHNFAASTYGDRASVMDYPAPRTKIVDGEIDLSDAYGVGIGEWDKFTVQYAYSEFPAEDEDQELAKLVANAIEAKMLYVTDADARPAGAAHPLGNLWDNGAEPVAALQHELRVRRIAINRFGESAVAMGEPLADLEKSFVPVYLHHRYQVEATAKMLGGYEYSYALRGDEQVPLRAIPLEQQVEALEVLAQTLRPVELVIPQSILDLIPPRIRNSASDRERFDSQTSPIFDPGSAIRAAAQLTIGNVLQPQRASRMASVGEDQLSLRGVIETLAGELQPQVPLESSATMPERHARRIVERAFVEQLISLSASQSASADARAIARRELMQLNASFKEYAGAMPDTIEATAWRALTAEIERFLNRDYPEARPASPAELPPGSPIGS